MVKEEPSDTLTIAADDYVLDSVDPCKAEKSEILSFHALSPKQENETIPSEESLDANVLIDFECKDVKLQPTSLSTNICKSEYQSCQPIEKIEKENQSDSTNENIFVDFECKDVKLQPTSLSTNICKSEYQNCQSVVKIEKENQSDSTNENIFVDFECKDVKLQPASLSTNICKSEYQSCQPIIEKENQNPHDYVNKKKLIILIKKGFNYDDNCRLNANSRLKLVEYLSEIIWQQGSTENSRKDSARLYQILRM
ncbi:uncharacterized protein LOC111693447 [Trichogramma pretiosum]|uniref:uncharacterized protein LOC111693447 n=1 Tax=Trichogramma pretiosum TaxID=7493 RepID=UPI000C71B30A|nr:uncharacterized protein LOC111693447 [Trichogramma pretiosum]